MPPLLFSKRCLDRTQAPHTFPHCPNERLSEITTFLIRREASVDIDACLFDQHCPSLLQETSHFGCLQRNWMYRQLICPSACGP